MVREDLEKIVKRTRHFFADIAGHVSTDRVCAEDGVSDCGDGPKIEHMYAKVPLWPSFSEKLAPYLGDDIDANNVNERIDAFLEQYDLPMATKRLRNTVMERLGPGCPASFFDEHIAKIPKGRKYEPVPKRKAYMPAGWGGDVGVEARFDAELLKRAIEILQKDTAEHKSGDVFVKALEDDKLGDFFSAAYSKDKTRFKSLFTEEVLEQNGIVKRGRKTITWQYQG